jgi:hypothetical protein
MRRCWATGNRHWITGIKFFNIKRPCIKAGEIIKNIRLKNKTVKKIVWKKSLIISLQQFFITAQGAAYLSRKVEGNGPAKP